MRVIVFGRTNLATLFFRRRRFQASCGVAVFALALSGSALAQATPAGADDPLAALLARPLTSGAVVLLAEFSTDARAQLRLTEALASPDASVRAVAARVSISTRSVAQVPALRRAMAADTGTVASPEIVRALLALGGTDAPTFVVPELGHMGADAIAAFVELTARVRPETLGPALIAIRSPADLDREIGRQIALGMRQNPAKIAELIAVLQSFDRPQTWAGCLEAMRERAPSVPIGLLEAGLASRTAAVREAAVWTVAQLMLAEKRALPTPPAGVAKSAQPADGSSWEALGRELVARSFGEKPAAGAWTEAIRARSADALLLAAHAQSPVFATAERHVLEELFGEAARPNTSSVPRHAALRFQPTMRMRTFDWPAPGVASDLLRVTGCVPDRGDQRVLTSLVYRPDGSLRSGAIEPTGLSPECVRAGKNALMLGVAGRESVVTPDAREVRLIILERDALACADAFAIARTTSTLDAVTSGQQVEAPHKTRNVNPVYPMEAQNNRIQGVVLLEAVISPQGCIASVELQRNVHPLLDLAAIDAVLGWRYTPTLLAGAPVPVVMTITINFLLGR